MPLSITTSYSRAKLRWSELSLYWSQLAEIQAASMTGMPLILQSSHFPIFHFKNFNIVQWRPLSLSIWLFLPTSGPHEQLGTCHSKSVKTQSPEQVACETKPLLYYFSIFFLTLNQWIIHHLSSKGRFQTLQLYWHFCSQYKCHASSGSDNEMWCHLFAWVFKVVWWLLFHPPYPSFCTALTAKRAGLAGNSYLLDKAYTLM